MSQILYGKMNHSSGQHKYIDAIHMSNEEYFSKYEITLTNKLILFFMPYITSVLVVLVLLLIILIYFNIK